jgi:probable phosphoglycerate mutase
MSESVPCGQEQELHFPRPGHSQTIFLASHGETVWSKTRQLTGNTDLSLTDRGEHQARALGQRLHSLSIAKCLVSPFQRTLSTCALAGFGEIGEIEPDLVEWDYGRYEGINEDHIWRRRPGWELFRNGCPGGETPRQVAHRADRVIRQIRETKGDVLLFSSVDFLRMFTARWLGLPPAAGEYFSLGMASLSALAYEHRTLEPIIAFWDDVRHINSIFIDPQ